MKSKAEQPAIVKPKAEQPIAEEQPALQNHAPVQKPDYSKYEARLAEQEKVIQQLRQQLQTERDLVARLQESNQTMADRLAEGATSFGPDSGLL